MSDEIKLLPCPFCGLPPREKEGPNFADVIVYWIKCSNYKCAANPNIKQESTPKAAAKSWNTRAIIEEPKT